MSRLIVKNLPQSIKEEYFRSVFAAKGEVTDIRLCRTKDGQFRRFGFVGYKTEAQAKDALKFFNNSFINTSKIEVEIARNLGDKEGARPWSKYSEQSSAFQKRADKLKSKKDKSLGKIEDKDPNEQKINKKKKKSKVVSEELGELEDDPEFQEFLNVHQSRSNKSLSSNDIGVAKGDGGAKSDIKPTSTKAKKETSVVFEDSESSDDDDEAGNVEDKTDEPMDESDADDDKKDTKLSDMDYLRTKMTSKTSNDDQSDKEDNDDDNDDDDEENNDDDNKIDETDDSSSESSSSDEETNVVSKNEYPKPATPWTIKMRGLPFQAKEKHINEFFSPLKLVDVRFVMNNKGKPSGCAFVDFTSKDDLSKALKRDRDYLQGRYIELFKDENIEFREGFGKQSEENEKPWMKKVREGQDDQDESIGESGRLFLRNLAYTCTEDNIQALFEKHGPLSEVNLPLDKHTNKTIGIGFVTFLMPEHAVKAFNELDGTVFQGRLLHILPGKAKKSENDEEKTAEDSYKKKNEAKKKSQSSSDHNWNTLFLGVNAVADVMADKYNTSKRDILDAESSNSLAVRMALGETQLVAETRKFLTEQGVKLGVFGQAVASRSKTVIVAKNLPFGTDSNELKALFSPFGQLGRVVLPPSGITALIEISEPSAARKAFQKLAYTKFKNAPLYLEWAPGDVFVEGHSADKKEAGEIEGKTGDEKENSDESDTEESEGKTLFVKNLNFETTEDALKEMFSKAGPIKTVTIAKKKDPKKQGNLLSMGYGFVEYKKKSSALEAIKDLQHSKLDEHALELKLSHRKTGAKESTRHKASTKKQKSSKILVRNVPFEATTKEIRELFNTFGEIKTLRLPKKMTGTGPHRGFAFVDFLTKQDAKRAFEALCTSTHLYGRRLVLEWAEDEDDVDALRKRTAEHFHGEPNKTRKKKDLLDAMMDSAANKE